MTDILNSFKQDPALQEKIRQARAGLDKPIGFCGHHCGYCFLTEGCGGCRSEYNCCSFATLFDSQSCPNVSCATERKLEGCYMCDDLEGCDKGYYSRKDEFVAKATALFIKEYGKDCYTNSLDNAIKAGQNYPKNFDAAGSIPKALDLLKKYLLTS